MVRSTDRNEFGVSVEEGEASATVKHQSGSLEVQQTTTSSVTNNGQYIVKIHAAKYKGMQYLKEKGWVLDTLCVCTSRFVTCNGWVSKWL